MKLKIGNKDYSIDKKILHMAILNTAPDSFSDGGKFSSFNQIDTFIENSIRYNVDIIDVGGESTRPGAKKIALDEELERTIPVIQYIKKNCDINISIDTYKSEVAREALENGAVIVNDISAGTFDKEIFPTAAKYNATIILMHIKGEPQNMQNNPVYHDIFSEIRDFLEQQISEAKSFGINNIVIDPGIGFGKTFNDNYKLIVNLNFLKACNIPILIGASRKSFLAGERQLTPVEREEGTIAVHTSAVMNGARIIRAHDIVKTSRMIEICEKLLENR